MLKRALSNAHSLYSLVQGFDIDQIEARLILGGKWDGNGASDDILDGIGGSQIGGKFSFKKMSEYTLRSISLYLTSSV